MRLNNYILGENAPPIKIQDVIDRINNTASPKFLDIIKREKRMLYRGSTGHEGYNYLVRPTRLENRVPKDIPQEIHDGFNKLFTKRFGWPVRNGVFATSDQYNAEYYGTSWCFFPIGNYKFVWASHIADLYDFYRRRTTDQFRFYLRGKYEGERLSYSLMMEVKDFLKDYSDKYLKIAIAKKKEISFNCKQYILATKDIEDEFFKQS
jgi:hypothetical protein